MIWTLVGPDGQPFREPSAGHAWRRSTRSGNVRPSGHWQPHRCAKELTSKLGHLEDDKGEVTEKVDGALANPLKRPQPAPSRISATVQKGVDTPATRGAQSANVGQIGSDEVFIHRGVRETFEGGHVISHFLFDATDKTVDNASSYGNLVPMSRYTNVVAWARKEKAIRDLVNEKKRASIDIPIENGGTYEISLATLAQRFGLNLRPDSSPGAAAGTPSRSRTASSSASTPAKSRFTAVSAPAKSRSAAVSVSPGTPVATQVGAQPPRIPVSPSRTKAGRQRVKLPQWIPTGIGPVTVQGVGRTSIHELSPARDNPLRRARSEITTGPELVTLLKETGFDAGIDRELMEQVRELKGPSPALVQTPRGGHPPSAQAGAQPPSSPYQPATQHGPPKRLAKRAGAQPRAPVGAPDPTRTAPPPGQ